MPMSKEQAEGARDALAMLLYSRLFDWLVNALNSNIERAGSASGTEKGRSKRKTVEAFIGVLDIYGFESFQVISSLPPARINYFFLFCLILL